MGRLTARLVNLLRSWDRPSQIALGIALTLFATLLLLALLGAPELRQPALISLGGLFVIIQFIILWGNRGLVTPYTQAQRHFIAGDFDTARMLLENLRASGKADANALTLLGNTYRQLGRLVESEAVLREAIVISPSHHFPLYGFGRTLQAKGDYAEAAEVFQQVLVSGALPLVQFDLGDIRYRQGLYDEARTLLQAVKPQLQEPYRVLMANYLLFRLGVNPAPNTELIRQGLPYWQACAEQLQHTPYGSTLADDVGWMHKELQK